MFKPREKNPLKWIMWGIIGISIAALFALFLGFIVMYLWNWLMPIIFGLPSITYWQAWGLVILFHILFKGGSHGSYNNRDKSHPTPHFAKNWKKKFHDKMDIQNCDDNDLNKEINEIK